MLWPNLISFLIAAHAMLAHVASASTAVDDNSVGLIIVVTGKCVEGVIFNYRNGSSVVYGTGAIAGRSTQILLAKGETLSGVEWVPGASGCCADQLGTSFSFTTNTGRVILTSAVVGGCALGAPAKFQLERQTEHVVGLTLTNRELTGVQSDSLCHAGDLCFMQGYQCLVQGRQQCMTKDGVRKDNAFIKNVVQDGNPLCCKNCEAGTYASTSEIAGGTCAICGLFHLPNADQSACELDVTSIMILIVSVLAFLFISLGHKVLGLPPFWLLMLDRCCCRGRRRILAETCCPSYYFSCECKHPSHQKGAGKAAFSAVHPEDAPCCPHGWEFKARLQPGMKGLAGYGIARCKACTLHHDEWCVKFKQLEDDKLEAKLHDHVNAQLDEHVITHRRQLQNSEAESAEANRLQEASLEKQQTISEVTFAKHTGMHEEMEVQMKATNEDAHAKWKTQLSENEEVLERVKTLKAVVKRNQGKHEALDEQYHAHVKETNAEILDCQTKSASMQETLTVQLGVHAQLEDQLQMHSKRAFGQFEAQRIKDLEAADQTMKHLDATQTIQRELHDRLDESLKNQLQQVQDTFTTQSAHNDFVQEQHEAVQNAASVQMEMHCALDENLVKYKAELVVRHKGHTDEMTENKKRGEKNGANADYKFTDMDRALTERLAKHERHTDVRFQETHEDNDEKHDKQMEDLMATSEAHEEAHHRLCVKVQAHDDTNILKFEAHRNEMKNVHTHQSAALKVAAAQNLFLVEDLENRLLAHQQMAHIQFEDQGAQNREVQRQHEAMEQKESRQLGRHENLAREVNTMRGHVRKVHGVFESEHAQHREAQEFQQANMTNEHKEVLSLAITAKSSFESYKGLSTEQIRKHDVALQRLYNETGSNADKIGKQQMVLERIYGELNIPTNTMPTSWGSPQRPGTGSSGFATGDVTQRPGEGNSSLDRAITR